MSEPQPNLKRVDRRGKLASRVRLPSFSGKASAVALVACFCLTALLIPVALHLQPWIEFEIVVGVWWVTWAVVLTSMLYMRNRVSDDYQWRQPRQWFKDHQGRAVRQTVEGVGDGGWWYFPSIDFGFEGCAVVVLILIAIPLLIGLAWFLIEVAVPAVAFVMYFLVRGMLARVVNDRHQCQGRPFRALGYGSLWATAYTAPLAVLVLAVHVRMAS